MDHSRLSSGFFVRGLILALHLVGLQRDVYEAETQRCPAGRAAEPLEIRNRINLDPIGSSEPRASTEGAGGLKEIDRACPRIKLVNVGRSPSGGAPERENSCFSEIAERAGRRGRIS